VHSGIASYVAHSGSFVAIPCEDAGEISQNPRVALHVLRAHFVGADRAVRRRWR